MYHRTLERQLKKFLGTQTISKQLLPFLKAVSDTYTHADEDQKLLERSLSISSKELGDINSHLIEEKQRLESQTNQLEQANKVMIGREIKMVELKKDIAILQTKLSKNRTTNP